MRDDRYGRATVATSAAKIRHAKGSTDGAPLTNRPKMARILDAADRHSTSASWPQPVLVDANDDDAAAAATTSDVLSASAESVWVLYGDDGWGNSTTANRSSADAIGAVGGNLTFDQLFHQPIDFHFRVAILWVLAVLGTVGNLLVLLWIFAHRDRWPRINLLILHLTVADTLVIVWATCPQLAWEYAGRQWEIGDAMCRLFKFLQTVSISVSNYMVVVLAVDRYCAVRRPLKKAFSVTCLAGTAWVLALTINSANLFVFETKEINGEVFCRNFLYDHPQYFKAYLTAISVVVVIIPLLIICITYVRIFQKIASKTSKCSRIKPGKVHLQATPSTTLPKAKAKTFKMTIVIVVSFLLCNTPYFICDMWRLYGGRSIPSLVWSLFGSLAVSNSSSNPFVILGFNSTKKWWLKFWRHGEVVHRRHTVSGTTSQTHSVHFTLESVRMSMDRSSSNSQIEPPNSSATTVTTVNKSGTCSTNTLPLPVTTVASTPNFNSSQSNCNGACFAL